MKIYKGCNQEITVQIAPCCIDVEGIDNLVLNFYTIGDTSIEFSGESITVSGKNATVVFQPAQLELLTDGIIRYVSQFDLDEEEKVFDMSTTYYLKTPANYVEQHFITEENMVDYIENSEDLKDWIDDKVSGYTPSADTATLSGSVEALSAATVSGLSGLSQDMEELSGNTVSGLTNLEDKFSGYTLVTTFEAYTGETATEIDSKIPKPGPAGKGNIVNPIYIDRSGNTQSCRVSTTTSTRWNSLVASDSAGITHAGRIVVFHQSGQESGSTPQLGKLPTIDGFTAHIVPSGTETNELTNENQRYIVDSRHYMKIQKVDYFEFINEEFVPDVRTVYLIPGDEFRTECLIQNPKAYRGVNNGYTVEGTIVYQPYTPEHIEFNPDDELSSGTYPDESGENLSFYVGVKNDDFPYDEEQHIYYTVSDDDLEFVVERIFIGGAPSDSFNCYFADLEGNLVHSGFTGNFNDTMEQEATYEFSFIQGGELFDMVLHYLPMAGNVGEVAIQITDKSGIQKNYEFLNPAYWNAEYAEETEGCFKYKNAGDELVDLVPDLTEIDERLVTVENDLLEKQDELTPGNGISIDENNVISCTIAPESGVTTGQVQTMISTEMEAETARTESTYAKQSELADYSTTADTADAISSALTDYSTTADTASAITDALSGYATENWVQQQGYITGCTPINDAGNNYTPVYVSGGTVVAADTSYPGRRWGVPMFVNPSDGGVEGGAFLDFHNSANTYSDFSGRIRKKAETAGFSFVYDVSGQETNPLASNENYAVDSKNIIHIVKLTQQQYNDIIPDNYTLYIIV